MTNSLILQIAIAVFGSGGLIAGVATLLKLRPDRDVAVITQAQGAVAAQEMLLRDVERNRDYWKSEAGRLDRENKRLRTELERFEGRVTALSAQLDGVRAELHTLRQRFPTDTK